MTELLLFGFTILINGIILLLLVYFVLILTELESDYVNAQECCIKLNKWVVPKFAAHGLMCLVIMLGGHLILFAVNVPIVIWMASQVVRRHPGNLGIYDPTEIHNRGVIKIHLRTVYINIVYYLGTFFVYIFFFITALLKGDPIRRHEDYEIVTEI